MTSKQNSQVTMGVLFIAIGLILLAQQLRLGGLDLGRLWPVVLIVIAAGQLSTPVDDGEPRRGLGLLMVGTIMLLHTTRILTLGESWPLFIVAFGVSTMFGGRAKSRRCRGDGA